MNNIDSDSADALGASPDNPAAVPETAGKKAAALKARLAKILSASGVQAVNADDGPSHFTFGVERIDSALRGNAAADGLPRGALHELHAAEKADYTSTAAMALLLAERCRFQGRGDKSILWISESSEARRQGRLYPPGIAELGMDPASIVYVDAPDSIALLRAASDGARSSAMGAVIIELAGKKPKGLDMTATRRLSLSAQKSGVPNLMLRNGADADDPLPTAAFSRWQISAAPSSFLSTHVDAVPALSPSQPPDRVDSGRLGGREGWYRLDKEAPGHSAFDITLLRHRSGLYGLSARLEWNCDDHAFRERQTGEEAPDIGVVPTLAAERAVDQTIRAA